MPENSKPLTQLEHTDAKSKTEAIAEQTPETKETGTVASTTETQPIPAPTSVADSVVKKHDSETPTNDRSLQYEKKRKK